jgi:hypothetical protein
VLYGEDVRLAEPDTNQTIIMRNTDGKERQGKPMLQPKHFEGTLLRYVPGRGITFETNVDDAARRDVQSIFECSSDSFDSRMLDKLMNRHATRIRLNPETLPADELDRALGDQSDEDGQGSYYMFPEHYDSELRRECTDGDTNEGQQLIVVASDDTGPIGYANLSVSVSRYESDSSDVYINVDLAHVYVRENKRKQGYGLDLSVACGQIACAFIDVVYRAVPARTAITCHVHADFVSEEGEIFSTYLANRIQVHVDSVRHSGTRRSVMFTKVVREFGW